MCRPCSAVPVEALELFVLKAAAAVNGTSISELAPCVSRTVRTVAAARVRARSCQGPTVSDEPVLSPLQVCSASEQNEEVVVVLRDNLYPARGCASPLT